MREGQIVEMIEEGDAIWDLKHDPDLASDRVRKMEDVLGVALHTTGYGLGLKRLDKRHGSDLDSVDVGFANFQASNLTYKPHFLVGRTGRRFQFCPLKYRAHHIGGQDLELYADRTWSYRTKLRGTWMSLHWWTKAFPNLASPLDLPFWNPGPSGWVSANSRSIGVDFLAPLPGQRFTAAQYQAGAELVA